MALTPDVVDGAIIETAWGNETRNRAMQVFATAAERDAQWTAPPNGSHCVTLDTYTVWVRRVGAWYPLSAHTQVPTALGGDVTAPASANTTVYAWDFPAIAAGETCLVTFSLHMTQASVGAVDVSMSAAGTTFVHQFGAGGSQMVLSTTIPVRTAATIQARVSLSTWGAKATVLKQASIVTAAYSPAY